MNIEGTVSITGKEKFNGRLTAVAEGFPTSDPSDIYYRWTRDGVLVLLGSSYTCQSADIGTTLTCVITAENYHNSIQASTGIIGKSTAPSAISNAVSVPYGDSVQKTHTFTNLPNNMCGK